MTSENKYKMDKNSKSIIEYENTDDTIIMEGDVLKNLFEKNANNQPLR